MKRCMMGVALLALAVVVVGCNKPTTPPKKAADAEKPAAAGNMDKPANTPVEHKAMKPVTPAAGTESQAETPETMPDMKKSAPAPESKSPEANLPETKPEKTTPEGDSLPAVPAEKDASP